MPKTELRAALDQAQVKKTKHVILRIKDYTHDLDLEDLLDEASSRGYELRSYSETERAAIIILKRVT